MYMVMMFLSDVKFRSIDIIMFICFQGGTPCHGLQGYKLPLIQLEVLNIYP